MLWLHHYNKILLIPCLSMFCITVYTITSLVDIYKVMILGMIWIFFIASFRQIIMNSQINFLNTILKQEHHYPININGNISSNYILKHRQFWRWDAFLWFFTYLPWIFSKLVYALNDNRPINIDGVVMLLL
jgi:hypothetical protein